MILGCVAPTLNVFGQSNGGPRVSLRPCSLVRFLSVVGLVFVGPPDAKMLLYGATWDE